MTDRQQGQQQDGEHRDRLARAVLTWIAEPGDVQLGILLQQRPPEAVVASLISGTALVAAPAIPGLDRAWLRWAARLGDAPTAVTVEAWQRDGIRLVCPGDPEWPGQLDVLGDGRPWGLWVRGQVDLRFACLRSVSIVGTRAATAYGTHVTTELAATLAERGLDGGLRRRVRDRQPGPPRCARRRGGYRRGPALRAGCPVPARPPRPVRGHRGPWGAGQRAAAGPYADPARVPGAQPADRRAQPRNRAGRGLRCAAGRLTLPGTPGTRTAR